MNSVLVAMGLVLVVNDLAFYGLGTANGRTVSFLDSLLNCYEFRAQQVLTPVSATVPSPGRVARRNSLYHITSSQLPLWWRIRTLVLSFVLKFGSSTFVSVCLWRRPVVFKGPRHFVSFFLCLLLIQFFPGDWAFQKIRGSPALQLVIRGGTTLYKFRKTMFVVEVFRGKAATSSVVSMVGLAVVTVDGNGLARNVENVICNRGLAASCQTDIYLELLRAISFFWQRNWSVVLTTVMLWTIQSLNPQDLPFHPGASELLNVVKVFGLVLLLHRNKVLELTLFLLPHQRTRKAKTV